MENHSNINVSDGNPLTKRRPAEHFRAGVQYVYNILVTARYDVILSAKNVATIVESHNTRGITKQLKELSEF
jgi:hypothetical protein